MEAAERAVALAPDLPEALASRGWLRMGSEWEGANRDLDRAVALGAGDAVAHRNRAVLLYCLGRFSEAEAEARRGIDLDPLGTQAWNTLGMVLTATGKPKEAQRVLERALEIYGRFEMPLLAAQTRVEIARRGPRADGLSARLPDLHNGRIRIGQVYAAQCFKRLRSRRWACTAERR